MDSTPTTTKPTAGWLHEIVQPFAREKTGEWKERQRITTLIEKIKDAATEADECLEKDDLGDRKIEQAQTALAELEEAWLALRGLNAEHSNSHPDKTP